MKQYRSWGLAAIAVTLVGILSFNLIVYAQKDDQPGPKFKDRSVYISPEEQLSKILNNNSFSKEKKDAAYEKYLLGNMMSKGSFYRERSEYGSNVMNVPWCQQETNYYCGPATVQQILYYLNGYAPSQDELASEMNTTSEYGTDNAQIVDYLNAHTNKVYEARWWWKDKSVLEHMVVYGTDHNDQPIVAYIEIPTKNSIDSWPNYTTGHYLTYNGYSDGGSTIHVTDPYAHKAKYNVSRISDGKYTVTSWEAEKVTRRVNW